MRPAQRRTYGDLTAPLRQITAKHTKFRWTQQCEKSFKELKRLLMSDKAMAQPGKPECAVMKDPWGWEQQWLRSTG